MTGLLGSGVLMNWGGVVPESETDFNAWHSLEHMPERLAVPGFLRGRRAVAVEGTPDSLKYLMMYEAATPEVFISEPYLVRLNDPTPWTQRILSAYVAPCRTVCRVLASKGHGTGGWAATIQFDAPAAANVTAVAKTDWIEGVMALPGIVGAHALEGDAALGQQQTKEKKFRESRGDLDRTVALAFMIDGLDRQSTTAALDTLLERIGTHPGSSVIANLYLTQHVLLNIDVAAR